MLTIIKLFGKSPFAPLQAHIKKVSLCIDKLKLLLEALKDNNPDKLHVISKDISKLEHEADLTKNDIRNHLPSTLFMPVNRAAILEILSLQDDFADTAEDIAGLVTLHSLENYHLMQDDFESFFQKNINTFFLTCKVIYEFDTLLESSFGGLEARRVKEMIDDLAYKEHELDRQQYHLMKKLFNEDITTSYKTFYLWTILIREVGSISNLSEKLGNRIRMILELK
jgi:uncharacterized protein